MKEHHPSQPISEEAKILAAGYALGDLSPAEIARLEELVSQNPDLLKELHALQASFELMPQALPQVTPPVQLEAKIAAYQLALKTPTPVQSTGWIRKLLLGVATFFALALIADNFRLRHQLHVAQQSPSNQVASILQQPKSRLIALTSQDSQASGTLLFTPGNWQEVIVSLGNLPPLPPEQIYRMWLALDDGEVIYCGEFNTDRQGAVFVRLTPLESPPKGVKATELFVTTNTNTSEPDPSGKRVMTGAI